MMYFLSGILLGLPGSLHCAGMCGPILVLINRSTTGPGALPRILAYQGGRVFMYAALGLVAGFTGRAAAAAGLGRAIGLATGALLVLTSVGMAGGKWTGRLTETCSSLAIRAGTAAATLTRGRPIAGHAILGVANGLLPCGLLYAALGTSLALGSVARAASFMFGFGLGTTPALILLTVSVTSVPMPWRRRFRFAAPILMLAAGSVLIARSVMPVESASHRHETAILAHRH